MLKNYLTIAYRTLRRRPGYTAINVVGLTVGMTVCLLIFSYATFRNETRTLPGVEGITAMSDLFTASNVLTVPLSRAARAEEPVRAYYYAVDSTFVRRMDITRTAWRLEAAAHFAGGGAVYLNEVATHRLGFARPEAALGEMISLVGEGAYLTLDRDGPFVVAGVVSSVYYRGYRAGIEEPLVLHYNPEMLDHALLLTQAGTLPAVVERVEKVWDRLGSVYPFDWRAYGDMLRASYAYAEDVIGLVATTALLAILICCLGLLGLAAYTTQTHVKEIGIRKVFGASAWDVVWLLSKGYMALFALAAGVAVPLAWLLNRWWLQNFAHPVGLGVWTFAGSIGTLLALVLVVIGSQTLKAARANPADSLRYE